MAAESEKGFQTDIDSMTSVVAITGPTPDPMVDPKNLQLVKVDPRGRFRPDEPFSYCLPPKEILPAGGGPQWSGITRDRDAERLMLTTLKLLRSTPKLPSEPELGKWKSRKKWKSSEWELGKKWKSSEWEQW